MSPAPFGNYQHGANRSPRAGNGVLLQTFEQLVSWPVHLRDFGGEEHPISHIVFRSLAI